MTHTIERDPPRTTPHPTPHPAPLDVRCRRAARMRLFRTALGATGMLVGDIDTHVVPFETCEARRLPHTAHDPSCVAARSGMHAGDPHRL